MAQTSAHDVREVIDGLDPNDPDDLQSLLGIATIALARANEGNITGSHTLHQSRAGHAAATALARHTYESSAIFDSS